MITTIENLPNVCIRNIVLDNSKETNAAYKITVDVAVKSDDFDAVSKKWYEDDFLLKHLTLFVVKSSNTAFNQAVSSGDIMINEDNINLYSSDSGDIQIKEISLMKRSKVLRQNQEQDSFLITVEFKQEMSSNDVDLYAMTRINMFDVSNSYGVDLKASEMRMYCGPIVSESIFRDGLIVDQSNLLETQDGERYYGPVHQHPSLGYMVGSKHTDSPHAALTVTTAPNTKLKDNRIVAYGSNNTTTQEYKGNAIFSGLDTSNNPDGTVNAIFTINMNTLLLTKSKYGRLLYNLNSEVYDPMLSNFKIKHLKIYKRRVKQSKTNKRVSKYKTRELLIESRDRLGEQGLEGKLNIKALGVSGGNKIKSIKTDTFEILQFEDDSGETQHMSNHRKISSLREESLDVMISDYKNYTRTFSFIDAEPKPKFDDKYAYEVDISFHDPSIVALQSIMLEIQESISNLDRYINMSLRNKNYDFAGKRLKEEYRESLLSLFPDSSPWIQSVVTYTKYYSLMKNLSELDQEEISSKAYVFLNPSSFDVHSAKSFLYKFKEFSCSFMSYFKISNKKMHSLTSGNSQRIYQNINFTDIEISHKFSNVLEFGGIKSGFEYLLSPSLNVPTLNPGTQSVITLTKAEMLARFQQEFERFPASQQNPQNTVSFLSPVVFHSNNQVHDLSDPISLNYRPLFSAVSNASPDSSPPIQTIIRNYNVSLDPVSMLSDTDTGQIDYIKASKYIGSRYGTLGPEELVEEYPESVYNNSLPEVQQTIINVYEDLPVAEIDPDTTTDVIHERYYRDIEGQTVSTPSNKGLFQVLFFSLQRVEYRQKTSDPIAPMNQENWKLLTLDDFNSLEGDVLFRLRPFSSVTYPNGHRNQIQAYNSIFIVKFPKDIQLIQPRADQPTLIRNLQTLETVDNTDYLVSNIIVQPAMRDGINSGLVYTDSQSTPLPAGTLSSAPSPPVQYEPQSVGPSSDSSPSTVTPSAPSPMSTSGGSYGY